MISLTKASRVEVVFCYEMAMRSVCQNDVQLFCSKITRGFTNNGANHSFKLSSRIVRSLVGCVYHLDRCETQLRPTRMEKRFFSLPYIRGLSDRLRKILENRLFSALKDKPALSSSSDVVYSKKCANCRDRYYNGTDARDW